MDVLEIFVSHFIYFFVLQAIEILVYFYMFRCLLQIGKKNGHCVFNGKQKVIFLWPLCVCADVDAGSQTGNVCKETREPTADR